MLHCPPQQGCPYDSDGTELLSVYLEWEIIWLASFCASSLLSRKLKIKIYRTIILPVVLYGCET